MTIKKNLSLIGILALAGCPIPDPSVMDGCPAADLKDRPQPDLLPPEAKCKAAQGLSGDNLLCVDFDKVTGLADPALAGWNFTAINTMCPGWGIINGKIQVNNFSTFTNGDCGFSLPAMNLKDADKLKYKSLTLSIIQRVHLTETDQKGYVLWGSSDASTRLVYEITGKQARQQNSITVERADLPAAVNEVYQYWFKLSAAAPGTVLQNWFIESIAVNANQ